MLKKPNQIHLITTLYHLVSKYLPWYQIIEYILINNQIQNYSLLIRYVYVSYEFPHHIINTDKITSSHFVSLSKFGVWKPDKKNEYILANETTLIIRINWVTLYSWKFVNKINATQLSSVVNVSHSPRIFIPCFSEPPTKPPSRLYEGMKTLRP